jgi:flagellar motor protein MotB
VEQYEIAVMEAIMRPIGPIGVGVLFLLLETVAPMQARQEQQANPGGQQAKGQQEQQHKQQQQQAKGQQEQQHKQQQQQAKSQQEQQHKQQQQQAKGQQEQQHRQQQQATRPSQQEQHRQRGQQQAVWQQHRAHSWQSEHRDWQQRGGYHGYRIPEDRYRRYFGPSHAFRIYRYPVVVVGGYPRFQYGGFWFSLMDPWPEYWSDDWYDNDDVYVDYYEDGYYLYNPRYPRDRIAITVYVR